MQYFNGFIKFKDGVGMLCFTLFQGYCMEEKKIPNLYDTLICHIASNFRMLCMRQWIFFSNESITQKRLFRF